jgi:UDP-N-acetylglucosamine 2-epimerase
MKDGKIKILTIFGTRKELIRLYTVPELFNRRRAQTVFL